MRHRPDSPAVVPPDGPPDFAVEADLIARGHGRIAGIDEAGRGPWAGPVAVAAVILDVTRIPAGLDDSKKLKAAERARLADEIMSGHEVAIAFAAPIRIDRDNIRAATLWAMARAAGALTPAPAFALIDGRDVPPGLPCAGRALVKGDARSLSIAAASIVAKVARDRHMTALAETWPGYGFERHMGYGTPEHAEALARLGPCPAHRVTFAPIRRLLEQRALADLTAQPHDDTASAADNNAARYGGG